MVRKVPAADPAWLDAALDALRRGLLIAIPTETVYGLAVLPNAEGLERLLEAKHRSAEKGIQLLIDAIGQVAGLAELTASAERLAQAFWPGPLTIVVPHRPEAAVPSALTGGRPTIGLRMPDHDVPRVLARALGPLAASSANTTGQPDATTAERVEETLADVVELIVDDGPVRGGTPSTVVDCSDQSSAPRVLREGAISSERIADALR